MKAVQTNADLHVAISGKRVGFVPTMGALHEGHLSLVRACRERGLFTVASIFVNPTQFNDPKDFEKYPVDIDGDLLKLESAGCDVAYVPHKGEVYPYGCDQGKYIHDFGHLEQVYEGAFRPGHFKGVAQVVHRLFELVQPAVAFFGEKDYQQLAVIRQLVETLSLHIEIVGMPTLREADGLAMSSRNLRLPPAHRQKAKLLHEVLVHAKTHLREKGIETVKTEVVQRVASDPDFRLEYFDLIHSKTYAPAAYASEADRAIIAAFLGEVRLIDNMAV